MPTYIPVIGNCADPFRVALRESNDCAVRALASAAALSYKRAHALLSAAGRREKGYSTISTVATAYKAAGGRCVAVYGKTRTASIWRSLYSKAPLQKGITVGRLLRQLTKGKYVIVVREHAFAVVDGTVYDGGTVQASKYVCCVFSFPE